ncbi:hypothetical protein Nepgr_016178 [Nepenthes gracilis]|uniref:EID1-like F-box protein 3 n=1 Tax=Nepenthes gracilis TaxID=150966 RepID=A0AAD3XR27_NEPGR|nr:hypothetical protein Nepgr_016178 [Nepenthes gracilis]
MATSQRVRHNLPYESTSNSGIFNERILVLVFESMNWDLHAVCAAAAVNQKLRAVAKRLLWRELCRHRVPRMAAELANGGGVSGAKIGGGWAALAKLLFYCCGCQQSTRHFLVRCQEPGHFMKESRFSKTSGRSFLAKRCRGDVLYMSDPCEHSAKGSNDDLGVYRGVFSGFVRSRTRACLIGRQAQLEDRVQCPYCGARVWSMTAARMVPKTAARRLGSHDGGLEYFVCINGHLHGTCWLVPLSSDDHLGNDDDDDGGSDDDGGGGGGRGDEGNRSHACTSSTGDDVVMGS